MSGVSEHPRPPVSQSTSGPVVTWLPCRGGGGVIGGGGYRGGGGIGDTVTVSMYYVIR